VNIHKGLARAMRKTGLEPAQVTLLDPKSKIWPLIKGSTRLQGTEQDPVRPDKTESSTQTATHFQGGRYGSRGHAKALGCALPHRTPNPTVPDLYADSKIFLAWRWCA
jgi:hypothetical protein